MWRSFALGLFVLMSAGCTAAEAVAPSTSAATSSAGPSGSDGLVDIGAGLRGPTGSTASVLATGVPNVAAIAIDDDDRLWLGTAAYADDGSDAVFVLDPTASESTPRAVVTGLHTVLGLAWDDGTLYVASAGGIDAYAGFDGSSFADQRSVLSLPSGTGEVNGLAMGPDGRLRVGISAPCDACDVTDAWSGRVLSVATDGSDTQVVASGIRAPVGLAFVPGTNDLLVTMNQRDDLGDVTPGDWLALVEPGQDWGFPDCYGQGGDACTDVPSPVAVLDQHAAVSGVAVTAADQALVAEWARGLVVRVTLTGSGPTLTGTPSPYLTGIANPVGIAIDRDGRVIVGDWSTGAIYAMTTH